MFKTHLQFTTSLPFPEDFAEQLQAEFPEAKCHLSFGGIIELRHGAITSTLDVSQHSIDTTTYFNDTKGIHLLLQIGVAILIGFPIANLIFVNTDQILFVIPILASAWAVRYFLRNRVASKVEAIHERLVAFLQEQYGGEVVA